MVLKKSHVFVWLSSIHVINISQWLFCICGCWLCSMSEQVCSIFNRWIISKTWITCLCCFHCSLLLLLQTCLSLPELLELLIVFFFFVVFFCLFFRVYIPVPHVDSDLGSSRVKMSFALFSVLVVTLDAQIYALKHRKRGLVYFLL